MTQKATKDVEARAGRRENFLVFVANDFDLSEGQEKRVKHAFFLGMKVLGPKSPPGPIFRSHDSSSMPSNADHEFLSNITVTHRYTKADLPRIAFGNKEHGGFSPTFGILCH